MPSSYPGGLDSFTTGTLTGVVSGSDHGNKADAINRIEAELGTDPSGAYATVKARMDAVESGHLPGAGVYSVLAYGVTGDGTTDDTAAARLCYAAAAADGEATVIWPGGRTYKISNGDSGGSIVVASGVTTITEGATFDISGAGSTFRLFTADGTLGSHVALTADTTALGSSVSVAAGAEAAFAVGDLVLVASEAYYEKRTAIYGANTGQKIGEICEVASTSSGTINFRNKLSGGYVDTAGATQLNYKTADTAFIAKITPVERVHFRGGKIIGLAGSGTTSTQQGVQITFGRDCTIIDMRGKDVAYNGFGFLSCVDCHMDRAGGTGFWNTNNGYATFVGDCSQDCTVTNIVATRCRHAFTTVSSGGSYGVTRRITVNGKSWFTHSTGDAWDAHAASEDIIFDNCYSFASASQGINFEGSRCTVIGGEFHLAASSGISLHNETLMPSKFTVKGPSVNRPGSHGVVVSVGISTGCIADHWGINVDADVHHPTGIGIWVSGSATLQWVGARVDGTVNFSQSTTAAFFSQYVDSCHMQGMAKNVINASVGFRQDNCSRGRIAGVATGVSASTGSGAYVKNATNIVISGGNYQGLGKGVNLDNTSTDCTVLGNDVTGCTTPVSPGTGTGHRIGWNKGYSPSVTTYSAGASPDLYTNNTGYPVQVVVSGGTVSLIKVSKDGGSTKLTTGLTAGLFVLGQGDSLEVTYSVTPTIWRILPLTP